ncbi:hypothetical protein NS115_03770 [Paenibacillus jamilae]|uniref:Uncharacterized protein n=1 Tax=Paenibacillus jamilae TaxID=114136 RepID=A0ACC4ZZT6_9BACL|nr:hypothetical protein [Paenibacillus jamilae]KTS84457.1 hypothetical protein NS115_03770 [Paenibacillus jamilae]
MIELHYVVGVKYGRKISYIRSFEHFVLEYTEDVREAHRFTKDEAVKMTENYPYSMKYWLIHFDTESGQVVRQYRTRRL